MRKHDAKRPRKRILAFAMIATLVAAVTTISSAAPAAAATFPVRKEEGSPIKYGAHRIALEHWRPTIAGSGGNMWFVVYDDSFNVLGGEYAEESGTTIAGVGSGQHSCYISPLDCSICHRSNHDLVFDRWDNGGPDRQGTFAISSADLMSGRAHYKIIVHGGSSYGENDISESNDNGGNPQGTHNCGNSNNCNTGNSSGNNGGPGLE